MPTPRVMARLYADAGCIRPKSASLEELPMGSDRREQRRGVSPTQFRRVLAYADETEHHTKSGQLGANAIRHERSTEPWRRLPRSRISDAVQNAASKTRVHKDERECIENGVMTHGRVMQFLRVRPTVA